MIHLLFFILGCCTGSFINVIFSRNDWYKGRSHCDSCGYILKWYDLIPVISFVVLGGKCRKCKTKIDCSHLFSELMMGATMLVSSLCFVKFGIGYGITVIVALFCMAVAAIEDYKEQMVYSIILNGGIIVTMLTKCGYYVYLGEYSSALDVIAFVSVLKLVMKVGSIVFKDKLGSGDWDIFLIIFVLGEAQGLILSVTFASVFGCLIYFPQIILKKRGPKDPFPFIPLLLMGTLGYLMI